MDIRKQKKVIKSQRIFRWASWFSQRPHKLSAKTAKDAHKYFFLKCKYKTFRYLLDQLNFGFDLLAVSETWTAKSYHVKNILLGFLRQGLVWSLIFLVFMLSILNFAYEFPKFFPYI